MLQQRAYQSRSMGPPLNIPSGYMAVPGAEEYSATEVATPSLDGTPDLRAFTAPTSQVRTLPIGIAALRAVGTTQPTIDVRKTIESAQPLAVPTLATVSTLPPYEVTNLLRAFGRRIDVLESLSFSQVPLEEIQEKFEFYDGRLLDLEQWRTDQERANLDPEPTKPKGSKRRLLPTETSSFASDGSFDSAAAAHTEAVVLATLAANAETGPRINALESRIVDLEGAALPSFARPWHIQVVLLPWGADLRGIWFSALDATQRSSQVGSNEWAGAQSAPRLPFKPSTINAWTTESIEAWADDASHWLSPKACGPTGTVFQRLASRGLVQDITLTASDSRHILSTLHAAFAKNLSSEGDDVPDQASQYQALREDFVPLRKVRKSSRLRFLSPAEMVSSAIWTASFLDSSVVMKVNDGQRRLYLTTPEAYLQPSGLSWAWQDIRQLPMFDATGGEQAAQATHAVIEACWTYSDHLDHPVSTQASFASHDSQWNVRSQQSMQDGMDSDDGPVSSQPEPRLKRQRTVSLPSSSSALEHAKEPLPKRRVASFEIGTTIPLSEGQMALLATAKRRRISISPEAERRGVGLTPRWSREPPSPFTSEHAGEVRSQGLASRKRGTTPFAYATPHSNSNYIGRVDLFGGDGDTEPDTDLAATHSESGEEEWHGVEDEDAGSNSDPVDERSAVDEAEIEEDDLDEGLVIYEG
ncbi:hypothetical protein LTR08_000635 [Meristemomyces frigidus]|nr:hypothetical protein LTR08_000635 [Meristemomyces frigidus]